MKRCLTVSQEYLKRLATTCINASTHITPYGAFFFCRSTASTHTHTHTHTARKHTQTQKRLADCRRCNTTFRECKPTTANENTTEKQGCNTTFRECKPNDLRPLQRRCVVLHIDKSISLSLSQGKRVGHHRVYTTPDKSTAVNRRRCIERYPPRRYVSNDIPPTTG